MQTWLIEKYLNSEVQIPGSLLQPVVNGLVEAYHRIGVWKDGNTPGKTHSPSHQVAEGGAELMRVHYDMPLALFENVLGPSMKYSMGLWENGAETLEEAQQDMLEDFLRKAEISDGDTILDIGCGFGSLAVEALKTYPNSTVHGLTLSKVQAAYIRERQAEQGHPLNCEHFHLIEADFNTVELGQKFDRILSIGVFEHITNLELALQKLRGMLTPQGKCLLHYIVYFSPLERMGELPDEDGFIAKYIFPGGRVWFAEELFRVQKHLKIQKHWFLGGGNYRRTLECWVENLWKNEQAIRAAPGLPPHALKLWDLYFRGCVGVFNANRGRYYGNAQFLLSHHQKGCQ